MHSTVDSCEAMPVAERSALRDRVLALTSALRQEVERAAGAAPAGVAELSADLVAQAARAGLAPLLRCAEAVRGLGQRTRGEAASADGWGHALGVVEQVLDGCLAGVAAERLELLCRAVSGRELGVDEADESGGAWEAAAESVTSAAAATATAVTPELFDAFAAEALDGLDDCEDQVLRGESAGGGGAAAVLDAVGEALVTITDAGAAVGLTELPVPPDDADADALLECIDAVRQRIDAACTGVGAPAADPAAEIALDELFLRLRRTVRDTARRHGGRVVLTVRGGELRLTVGLADRIYEPLAQLIAEAAAHRARAPALALAAERAPGLLVLTLAGGDDADGGAEGAEALHWIDARRPADEYDLARLAYRPDCVNVVQIITG